MFQTITQIQNRFGAIPIFAAVMHVFHTSDKHNTFGILRWQECGIIISAAYNRFAAVFGIGK